MRIGEAISLRERGKNFIRIGYESAALVDTRLKTRGLTVRQDKHGKRLMSFANQRDHLAPRAGPGDAPDVKPRRQFGE